MQKRTRKKLSRLHRRIKYPKLLLLLLTIAIAVAIFHEGRNYEPLHNFLESGGYLGTFFAGMFYAYGFTAAPATAVLLVLAKEQSLLTAVLLGGLGALISDLLIFLFVRFSFLDEIEELEHEKLVRSINKEGKKLFGHYYRHIFPTFAGFLIASPLPTEIGVSMMASLKKLSVKKFLVIAYILHSLGIFVILLIGKAV